MGAPCPITLSNRQPIKQAAKLTVMAALVRAAATAAADGAGATVVVELAAATSGCVCRGGCSTAGWFGVRGLSVQVGSVGCGVDGWIWVAGSVRRWAALDAALIDEFESQTQRAGGQHQWARAEWYVPQLQACMVQPEHAPLMVCGKPFHAHHKYCMPCS